MYIVYTAHCSHSSYIFYAAFVLGESHDFLSVFGLAFFSSLPVSDSLKLELDLDLKSSSSSLALSLWSFLMLSARNPDSDSGFPVKCEIHVYRKIM